MWALPQRGPHARPCRRGAPPAAIGLHPGLAPIVGVLEHLAAKVIGSSLDGSKVLGALGAASTRALFLHGQSLVSLQVAA